MSSRMRAGRGRGRERRRVGGREGEKRWGGGGRGGKEGKEGVWTSERTCAGMCAAMCATCLVEMGERKKKKKTLVDLQFAPLESV
jgi:hypothetical protein